MSYLGANCPRIVFYFVATQHFLHLRAIRQQPPPPPQSQVLRGGVISLNGHRHQVFGVCRCLGYTYNGDKMMRTMDCNNLLAACAWCPQPTTHRG